MGLIIATLWRVYRPTLVKWPPMRSCWADPWPTSAIALTLPFADSVQRSLPVWSL
jgi:hypothetical protein